MKVQKLTLDTPIERLNKMNKGTLMERLGIRYTKVARGLVEGEMPVDERTVQLEGILHGGAGLAFAETLSGLGSALLIDLEKYTVVGTQVSANHVRQAAMGRVKGIAQIVHQGGRTHVWNVDIITNKGRLVSSVRVSNLMLKRPL